MDRSNKKYIRISSHERSTFTKHLANYLQAGIPILQALELVAEHTGRLHAYITAQVLEEVRRGVPLSRALGAFTYAYPVFHVQLIAIGEASGTLPTSLLYVSELSTKRSELTRKLVSSLTYPACIALSTVAISVFLILYAFPKVVPLFRGLHTTLPLTTRILIRISKGVGEHGIGLAVGICCMVGVVVYGIRSVRFRPHIDSILLRIPIIGRMLIAYYLTQLFHCLFLLLKSGIRLDEAILFTQKSISQSAYAVSLHACQEAVLRGARLTTSLETLPHLYPSTVIQILKVGEMTGSLSESCALVSGVYRELLTEQLNRFTTLMEPALIAVMGCVVGFVSLAIITPMYSLTQALSGQ